MRVLASLVSTVLLCSCAGKVEYIRPTTVSIPGANTKIIDKPRDAVWNAAVPELGKQFFIINNLDKSSGLINISYSGDPEKYIDCGRITSYVKNARGERVYDFAGAKAQQNYEIMEPGVGLFLIDRRMALEGRVNLVFQELNSSQTRVTANTRYLVQRQRTFQNLGNNSTQTVSDSLSFNAGGSASFPQAPNSNTSECVATCLLEVEILSAVR